MTHTFTPAQLAWLEALESGEYNQTKLKLKDGDGYCCLGVACEISGLGAFDDSDSYHLHGSEKVIKNQSLPQAVIQYYGMRNAWGAVLNEGGDSYSLTHYNDSRGFNFKEIAAHIRANASEIFNNAT